jgi:hypothetical protein
VHRQRDVRSAERDADHVDAGLAFVRRADLEAEHVAALLPPQRNAPPILRDGVAGGRAHFELALDGKLAVARDVDAELHGAPRRRQQQQSRHDAQLDGSAFFDGDGDQDRDLGAEAAEHETDAHRRHEPIGGEPRAHRIAVVIRAERHADRRVRVLAAGPRHRHFLAVERLEPHVDAVEPRRAQLRRERPVGVHVHAGGELLARDRDGAGRHFELDLDAAQLHEQVLECLDAPLQADRRLVAVRPLLRREPREHAAQLGEHAGDLGRRGFALPDARRQVAREERVELARAFRRAGPDAVVEQARHASEREALRRRVGTHLRFESHRRLEHAVDRRRRAGTRVRHAQDLVCEPAQRQPPVRFELVAVDRHRVRRVRAEGAREVRGDAVRGAIRGEAGVRGEPHRFAEQVDEREIVAVLFLDVVRREHEVGADAAHERDEFAQRLVPPPLGERLLLRAAESAVGPVQMPHLAAEVRAARLGLERADAFQCVPGLGAGTVLTSPTARREQHRDARAVLEAKPHRRQHVTIVGMRRDEQDLQVRADVARRLLQRYGARRTLAARLHPLLRGDRNGESQDRQQRAHHGTGVHQTPSARRLASTSGKPASRIFRCTPAMS